jgi:predicted dehydrogenase
VGLDRHLPSFRALHDVDVVAVLDRDLGRAQRVAAEHRIARSCSTPEQLLDAGVDAVSIATPPWAHAELASFFLRNGVHVFCEKPMAMNLADAQQMADAAEAAGRILCLSHNLLWSRAAREAQSFLDGAPVDYVLGVQLSSVSRRLPTWIGELPSGLAFDESPHLMYIASHFMGGASIDTVRVAPVRRGTEPSSVEVLLVGEKCWGEVSMVLDAPVSEWQVMLSSAAGAVVMDLFRDIAIRIRPDGKHKPRDILRTSARAITEHLRGVALSGSRFALGRQKWGHDRLIREFVEAVRSGGKSPVPVSESLSVMALVEQVGQAIVASRTTV